MAEKNLMNGSSTRMDTGSPGKRTEVAVILGAQWGDEGKGKIVDLLCQNADVVCRCQVGSFVRDGRVSWREGYGNLLSRDNKGPVLFQCPVIFTRLDYFYPGKCRKRTTLPG